MPVVAVTGATGYLGQFVVPELRGRGFHVRALTRPQSTTSHQADGIYSTPTSLVGTEFIPPALEQNRLRGKISYTLGDLNTAAALTELVTGAEAVVHLAYQHVAGRYRGGEGSDLAGWLETNLNGSVRLLLAAQAAGVKRFFFLSSRAVFAHTLAGRVLDETHPPTPDSHYGAYKAAFEALLAGFAAQGMQTCAVRATGVYGLIQPPQRSKWWAVAQAVQRGEDVSAFTGGGTEVYGGDVARVIGDLLTRPEAPPLIIHLSERFISQREIVERLRAMTGKAGALPAEPPPPTNALVCAQMQTLGLTFSGVSALESTLHQLVYWSQHFDSSP